MLFNFVLNTTLIIINVYTIIYHPFRQQALFAWFSIAGVPRQDKLNEITLCEYTLSKTSKIKK